MTIQRRTWVFWLIPLLAGSGCYFPDRTPKIIANYQKLEQNLSLTTTSLPESTIFPEIMDACAEGQKLSEAIVVRFPETIAQECEWNKGENLGFSALDAHSSAFRSQILHLPGIENTRIMCSFQITSTHDIGRYNDALLLRLEDRVIAMSSIDINNNKKFLADVNRATPLEEIAFIGLAHKSGSYCPNGIKCTVPRSLAKEPLSVQALPEYLQFMPQETFQDGIKLELIITGNRSIIDCQHTGIELAVRYTYVEKTMQTAH